MPKLEVISNNNIFEYACEYLYNNYSQNFNNILYVQNITRPRYDFTTRRNTKQKTDKVIRPTDCDTTIQYNEHTLNIKIKTHFDNNNTVNKLNVQRSCEQYDVIFQTLTLTSDDKNILTKFVDESIEDAIKKRDEYKKNSNDTIRTFYWKNEYWSLFSKIPKRPLDTLHLKKGDIDTVIDKVDEFLKPETRDEYIKYGIPYKSVYLLYGVPGGGKTSLVSCIASHIDADIYNIPITSELKDSELLTAFSELSIKEEEDKQHIVVIEDIDCIFDERKKNDNNNITLQTLLNCLDGLTCVEGTILFLTANKPEILDYALIRSCRVDHKIKFDYADEDQTKDMFTKFYPDSNFRDFYKKIKHYKYTTASLQEFLFYNRKCDNILEKVPEFVKIIDKNDPSNLDVDKQKNNLYM